MKRASILEKAKVALIRQLEGLAMLAQIETEYVRDTKTIREFVEQKSRTYVNLLRNMLPGADTCPYCLQHGVGTPECLQNCAYGRQKGVCTQRDSHYFKVVSAFEDLIKLMKNYALEGGQDNDK